MALRGVKPKTVEKRLKAFSTQCKSWKDHSSNTIPKPYLIDTERGAENEKYVDLLEKGKVLYSKQTTLMK